MSRTLKIAAGAAAALAALFVASGLLIQALLTGARKDALVESLGNAARVRMTVGSVHFSLGQWLRLRPSVALEDIALGNPPGFRSASLLDAKRLEAQVRLFSLFGSTIETNSISLDQPRITVEKNAAGATNIEAFMKALSAQPRESTSGQSGAARGIAIDSLKISNGEIRFQEPGTGGLTSARAVHAIDIHLENFVPGQACRLTAGARLYEGNESELKFEGRAGPFEPGSIPLGGKIHFTVAPNDIPAAVRKEIFGTLLAAPGKRARVSLDATVQGNLYQTIAGPAKLELSNVMVGRDEKHLLALSGNAPAQFEIRKAMSTPFIRLRLDNAELRLGDGRWTGDVELVSEGPMTRGRSSGSIRNIDINQFLGSLTTADNKIQGQLDIPSYELHTAGRDAAQMRRSLAGTGRLEVSKGRLQALNLIGSIENAINKKTNQTAGTTEFTTLKSNLNIANEQMQVSELLLDSPAGRVGGNGTITFDQALRFRLDAEIKGRLAELLGRRGSEGQMAMANVPIDVSGSVSNPIVRPNVGKLAVGTGMSYLEQLLKKKLNK
jgi:AsmA protein